MTVGGRVRYAIIRILADISKYARVRRFQSFLIIVEAKAHRAVDAAVSQLITCLACFHQSHPGTRTQN